MAADIVTNDAIYFCLPSHYALFISTTLHFIQHFLVVPDLILSIDGNTCNNTCIFFIPYPQIAQYRYFTASVCKESLLTDASSVVIHPDLLGITFLCTRLNNRDT